MNNKSKKKCNNSNHKPISAKHASQEVQLQFMASMGPIPQPEILEKYERIQTGFANRIITMAEKNNQFRIDFENSALRAKKSEKKLGQIFGFMIGSFGLISATLLGCYEQAAASCILGGSTVLGLVTVFVTNNKKDIER